MININELLKFAITIEVSSQEFYKNAQSKTNDSKTLTLLKELYLEEQKHERLLQNLLDSCLYDGTVSLPSNLNINFKDSHNHPDESKEKLTFEDITNISLARENKAILLFENLLKFELPEEIKELFENLLKEEKSHHHQVSTLSKQIEGTMGNEN